MYTKKILETLTAAGWTREEAIEAIKGGHKEGLSDKQMSSMLDTGELPDREAVDANIEAAKDAGK